MNGTNHCRYSTVSRVRSLLLLPSDVSVAKDVVVDKVLSNHQLFSDGYGAHTWIAGVIPIPVVVFIVAAVISMGIVFCSKFETPPRYYKAYSSYLGFIVAVVWVYLICTEVVSVIRVSSFKSDHLMSNNLTSSTF